MKKLLPDELLEQLLVENSEKQCIKKLKGRQTNDVVKQGDNYVSLTWQEVVTVENRDGTRWLESVIVKSAPEGEHIREYIENTGIFEKEIMMYTQALPTMEKVLKMYDQAGEPLWPKCLGIRANNMLLLEDLTAKGFQKVDRLEGLDLEHSILAFRALAKFHTLSISLRDKLKLDSKVFLKYDKSKPRPKRCDFFKFKIKALTQTMRKEWEPKWCKLADHLEEKAERILDHFMEVSERKDNEFNVMNHGDTWTSNMLFKYSEYTGKVIGIRFVDFQGPHYGSFALDIQYLLMTSVQMDVLKTNRDALLKAYHETLFKTARKLNLTHIVIPSMENIIAEIKSKTIYGLVNVLLLLDMMLVDPKDAVDLETILKTVQNRGTPAKQSSHYLQRIRNILEPFVGCDFTTI